VKYVPYGPDSKSNAYLTRRAAENSVMQSKVVEEFELIKRDGKREKAVAGFE